MSNPFLEYLKSGLADFILEYMRTHKEEVMNLIIEVLTKLLGAHPEVKKQVLAAIDGETN